MTYEQALQIAIEQLDDAVDYLKAMNKGFPKVEKQVDELMSASNALRKALEQPEREWVGLTDHEIACLWGHVNWGNTEYVKWFGRELQARLKEKNT